MKIGYIFTSFPSKTETFAEREIETLVDSGTQVIILAAQVESDRTNPKLSENVNIFYRPPLFSTQALLGIWYLITRYPSGIFRLMGLLWQWVIQAPREFMTLLGNFHTLGTFAQRLDENNIPYIHAYFLSWPAVIGLALARITGRSFSISAHARDIFVEHGAVKLKATYAKAITTCTRQGLNYLKLIVPQQFHSKLHLNYHGIKFNETSLCTMPRKEYRENVQLIAVGRLIPKKGFDCLVKAMSDIRKESPNCTLDIIGEGPGLSQLLNIIEDYHLQDCVHLAGWQDNRTTINRIRSSTILIVPSIISADNDRDGIPNVILEAFSVGVPVIASRLPGISEAVIHGKTGCLIEPGNVNDLSATIIMLLKNTSLQKQLAENASKTVKDQFNLEQNVRNLMGLLGESHEKN